MELLKQLYGIHSMSGKEEKMRRFIKRYVATIDDTTYEEDAVGNVYITRGYSDTYPCVVAHLDQVQSTHSKDFKAIIAEDIIVGYSANKRCVEGLGADDKNGIWIGLKCLETFEVMKCAFFVGEEIGCEGSSQCNMSFFNDARFVVEPDRKGKSDLITNISGLDIASTEFLQAINYEGYGYKPTMGMMTDVLELTERGVGVSCINLSCGYYNPHTDEEFTCISDLENALEFVKHIILNCTDVYPHKVERDYGRWGYYGSYDGHYGSYNYESDVPYIPATSDHCTIETYIDELMRENDSDFFPEDLWEWVEEDLKEYITEEEFINKAYDYWSYYKSLEDEEEWENIETEK